MAGTLSQKLSKGEDIMCETYLDKFKQEMEPAKKIYTEEIKKLAENYDFLGEMKIREEPDIDTQDYVYVFKNLNGTSEEVLDKTLKEMYIHMKAFSKANGINEFCRNAIISLDGDFDEYY